MIDYPKTLIELLQNIKSLADGDLLEHEETYTEENLLRLFGTRAVIWQIKTDKRLTGWLEGIEHYIGELRLPNGNVFPGVQLSFSHGEIKENFHVHFDVAFTIDSNVTFTQIEQIFGPNWEIDIRAIQMKSIAHGAEFFPSTHKMGNTPIIYKLGSKPDEKSIVIKLGSNGNLQTLRFLIYRSEK